MYLQSTEVVADAHESPKSPSEDSRKSYSPLEWCVK